MGKFGIKKSFCSANCLKTGESADTFKLRLKNELERTHLLAPSSNTNTGFEISLRFISKQANSAVNWTLVNILTSSCLEPNRSFQERSLNHIYQLSEYLSNDCLQTLLTFSQQWYR